MILFTNRDGKSYSKHRHTVHFVKSKVDNKEPSSLSFTHLKPKTHY